MLAGNIQSYCKRNRHFQRYVVSPDLTPCDFFLWAAYQRHSFCSSTSSKFKRTETTHHNSCCKCWRGYAQVCLDRIRLSYWHLSCDKRLTDRTFVNLKKHVLQNHDSILAKSLIVSFQYNIESVYFFYSNPVFYASRFVTVCSLNGNGSFKEQQLSTCLPITSPDEGHRNFFTKFCFAFWENKTDKRQ